MLAHVDTLFSGAVPCRILAARRGEHGLLLQVRYTADRPNYSRGMREEWLARTIIPRGYLRRSRQRTGGYYVAAHDWCRLLASAGIPIADLR